MTPLEDLPIGQRIAITFLIVLAVLLILAMIGFLSGQWEAQGEAAVAPSPYDAEIIALERQAIDRAFADQIALLYGVWMKDPKLGPERAKTGAGYARKAYIDVRDALERRERR